jgi:MFS transporter, FHS family, L-fucose permease
MTGDATPTVSRTYYVAIALTLVMFAIWGLAHRLYDTLLPEFAAALSLNEYQTSLAGWALSFGYYFMALPAALISRNFGYKSGVVFGLGCFAVGMFLFYPAAQQQAFAFFLAAAVAVGSGLAILEVSADPLVVRLGPKVSAVRRLNVAQTLNPIGVIIGFFVGHLVLHSAKQHPPAELAHSLVTPFFFIGAGVLLFAFVVDKVKFPPIAIERVRNDDSTIRSFAALYPNRLFKMGVGAQFLCAVAQIVMWGYTIRFAVSAGHDAASAKDVLLWALIAFTVGRVIGTGLMYRFDPSCILAIFTAGGAVAAAIAAIAGGETGVQCIVAASFFLSVVFPTVFGNTIRDLGPLTKSGSAILMFAAGSGAAILAVLNVVTTPQTVQYVMIVPSICFAAITGFAIFFRRMEKPTDHCPGRAAPANQPAA